MSSKLEKQLSDVGKNLIGCGCLIMLAIPAVIVIAVLIMAAS